MIELIQEKWNEYVFSKEILNWTETFESKTALVDGNRRITYEELGKMVDYCWEKLEKIGLSKGDKVAVQMENHAEFVVCILTFLAMGVIPILILPAQKTREIEGILKTVHPKMYIYDTKNKHIEKLIEENHICFGKLDKAFFSQAIDVRMRISKKGQHSIHPIKPDDVALLLLSGGTTGIPKLIPRTHGDYIYNVQKVSQRCKVNDQSIFLAVIPMAHNFALANPGLLGTLMNGGTVVICQDAAPIEIFSLIEKEKVTYMALVPSILKMCMAYRNIDDCDDLSSLEMILVGGAMLQEETARKVDAVLNGKLIQVFGTAEGLICMNSPDDTYEIRVSCQGRPISELDQIKIVDENGNEVLKGEIGELITKGPYTIQDYYLLSDQQGYFNEDGFYLTGDKARVVHGGNIQILGRVREQINRAGEKIMPSEVEEIIQRNPNIIDCAVVGVEDSILGNRICAYVTCRKEIGLDEMREFLTDEGLASFKLPDTLKIVEQFPYTAVGKIDKKKLCDLL